MSHSSLGGDRRCGRLVLVLLALTAGPLGGQSAAAGVGYGDIQYDPNPYLWISTLVNDAQSTSNVARIELDSSSSTYATAWNWGLALDWPDNSNDGDFLVSGLGTSLLGLDFTFGGLDALLWPGLAPGQFRLVRLSPNIQLGTPVEAIIGVTARFHFVDGSQWIGRFTDQPAEVGNPFPNGRYTIRQIDARVPEPGTLGLLALGIVGLACCNTRRRRVMSMRATGLLATGLLAATATQASSITFSTDTETTLRGSFSVSGSAGFVERNADNFRLLPVLGSGLIVYRGRNIGGQNPGDLPALLGFLTPQASIGSIATQREEIYELAAQDFGSASGFYTNSLPPVFGNDYPGPRIYVLFSNWQDSGGVEGTFSGGFCFSTSEGECREVPEPGSLALLGLGLTGLALTRRWRVGAGKTAG